MNIGISGLFIRPGQVGGAETMLHNLLEGLFVIRQPTDKFVVFSNYRTSVDPPHAIPHIYLPNIGRRNRFVQETAILPAYTRQYDSLLFPNYFTPPVKSFKHTATVIHDLQYIHFPENFSRKKRWWLRAAHEMTLRRADVVITISEFTRNDILARYGSQFSDKIHVIPNPISWDRLRENVNNDSTTFETPTVRHRYVLSVAAQYHHKNLETLVRAFAKLRADQSDLRLVLVGQMGDRLVGVSRHSKVNELIRDLNLRDSVTITGYITDAELGEWYRKASLFVFPSLFEGFGMPPIEALGMGLPVLTTPCGAIPEVTKGLATIVRDPLDVSEMATAMHEMLDHPQRYAPSPESQDRIRNLYSPKTVASSYYRLLTATP